MAMIGLNRDNQNRKKKKTRPHKGGTNKLRGRSNQDGQLQVKEHSENFLMYVRNIGG
jgi:hypothetical protein